MGKEKHGFLTPKAISNRIKAKGLQKLKWYCQMCQKQCRDENGFKCHLMSESHQRQLLLVSDNPSRFVDEFSKEFCESFIDDLRKQFGTRRVIANLVYQTYIAFRHHIHMNSTQWETLTQFVKWLGREGMCKVDETERGWYIAYIDRDPATIERQEKLKRKEKLDSDDSERTARYIDQQIERGAISSDANESVQSYSDLIREGDDDKITFNVSTGSATCSNRYTDNKLSNPLSEPKSGESRMKLKRISGSSDSSKTKKKRMSSLDEIKLMEERRLEKENRKDYWLHEGIVVKIITKRLGEKYFNKKGVVTEVIDNYTGMIDILGVGDILKLNQIYVETVIPNIGKNVLIVNGAYRGNKARLVSSNSEAFSVDLELCEGLLTGKPVLSCEYEDVCKLIEQ